MVSLGRSALGCIVVLLSVSDAFAEPPVIEAWVSASDLSQKLTKVDAPRFETGQANGAIVVDPRITYQRVLGIGSSLEHATCHNLTLLSPESRERVIQDLVDPDRGIGMNLMRICIGTSDFTGDPWYSYDDMPEGQADPDLAHFSIDKDRAYVLPILKAARACNPDLLFFASPWSPPGWMKARNKGMCGGALQRDCYDAYARYLLAFTQAYAKEGISVYALTLQNEPGVSTQKYPSCRWTGEEQHDFIRDHAGPVFSKAGAPVKLWCFDHNFNNLPFPRAVLSDPKAASFVEGTAFHLYEGDASAMTQLHNEFPDKQIFFSEGSVYDVRGALEIISYFRNWAQSYNAWVTLIDQNGKPNNGPHECDPTMIVVDPTTKELTYRFDFYMYGQFSKFVRRGALRIESTPGERGFGNVAFLNPDGTIAVIAANADAAPRTVTIQFGAMHFSHILEAQSVATYRWKA